MKRIHQIILAIVAGGVLTAWFITTGCEGPGGSRGPSLFAPAGDSEKWTILCRRIAEPGHAQQAEMLANMLRQVKQLDAKAVKVVSDSTESSVFYGEYRRVPSAAGSDQLAFPPELHRDMAFIRSLSDGASSPFLAAQPEQMDAGPASAHPEWEVTKATATYSLLVAVFYNTEGFQQRKEVAEQYVAMLREEGFTAWYYHEPVKSFVFVGEFAETDVVNTPEGLQPGPRVEQLIARREDEFRHFTENGHIRKHYEGPGREVAPLTKVVPLPRKDAAK
jgi:hypothetical protein